MNFENEETYDSKLSISDSFVSCYVYQNFDNTYMPLSSAYNPSLLASYNPEEYIVSSIENSEVQDSRALLYSSSPYPIPAQNYVKSIIYWNSIYDIRDAKFTITDIFGNIIPNKSINIEQTDTYKGILNWDCNGQSSGIYFIRVQLGSETLTVPIAIGK